MHNAFQLNRVFAVITIAAMVLGSLSAVLAPSTVSAAEAGDLIKNESLSTVYYYAPDGTRYIFPNEKTYFTWYSDFSDVETISDSALADIALGGNIVYRPGSYFIKVTSNPDVYAVSTDGTILKIDSAEVAEDLAGSDWESSMHDVPDVFWSDYTEGAALTSATAFDGMMYMDGSDYVLSWDGEKQVVSSAGRTANNMKSAFFLNGASIDESALTDGDDITSEVSELTDASQQGGVDEVVAEGDVTVKLSSSNPAGVSVPSSANMLDVLSIDLKAGSEATEVNEIAVSLIGLSSATDVSDVYLYEGSTRLTEARSINSSTRKATFGSLGIDLDANETRTITVRTSVSSTAVSGDEIQFGIDDVSDIDADGDVSGSFPLDGNVFSVSSTTVGSVTIIDYGTITNPYLGQNDAVVGAFKITTATEAGTIEAITLKVDNGADHEDFKLWVDDAVIATGDYIGDKLVAFDLGSGVDIAKGQNEIFELTADLGGEAADAVSVYLDKGIDIEAIGADYGFPMSVTYTGYDGTTGDVSSSTIQGGSVTLASSGPSAGDVQTNSQDVTLLNFTLTAAQALTVKDLDITVFADDDGDNDPFDSVDDDTSDNDGLINTGSEANITDIRIVNTDTDETLMGPLELDYSTIAYETEDVLNTPDNTQTIDFSDDFEMDSGETLNLAIVVDIDDTVTSGTEFGASIDVSGFQAEDDNGDTICTSGCTTTDVVPTSDIQGYSQQALSTSLTISLASTPGDTSTVRGVSDHTVNSFNFVAGSAGSVTVTNVILDLYADDDGTPVFTRGDVTNVDVNDFISSCSIYDKNGVLLDGPESPISTGVTVTFGDVDWTIDASENERLDVKCNFAKPSSGTDADYFAVDMVTADGALTVVDEDNNTVTPTGDAVNGGTTPTNVTTINEKGSLAVTVDSSTPTADVILTGTTENHVATFRFTATTEDFDVTTLSFTEEAAEDDGNGADATTYANNISLVTIEYVNEEETVVTETGTMVGNEATFTGLDMYVEYGDPALVDVYVNVPNTDRVSGSATSNERIEMGLSVGTGDYAAYGASSGASATAPSALETSKVFVVKETKPTVSLSSSSPSGTGKVPSDQEVFRINVSAASNEDVILEQLAWTFSSTDNAGNGSPDWNECDTNALAADAIVASELDFYNLNKEGIATALDVDADWDLWTTAGVACTTSAADLGYIVLDLTTPEIIPAGTTYSYALYLDSQGASSTNDDSIQFTLTSDPFLAITSFIDSTGTYSALTQTGNSFTIDDASKVEPGDLVCFDESAGAACTSGEEIALVTNENATTIYVVRGYAGTTRTADAAGTVMKLESSFVWQDDGATSVIATATGYQEYWGAYIVDSLPVTGNAISF